MARVHPTAIVDPRARLAPDVEVGPYVMIGPNVEIGAGTTIGAHTVIQGRTTIGRGNRIYPHCSLGGPPQDKKYGGEDTQLVIGDGNTIREFCTMNTGTVQDRGVTRVGNDNWIMAYVHIAHDCVVGDHTILANSAQLGGHVRVGDWAILGGLTGVHQFVTIGAHAMTAAGTILLQDLPPFVMGAGNPAQARGLNVEGLRRRGFSAAAIAALRRAYRILYREGLSAEQAVQRLLQDADAQPEHAEHLRRLAEFVRDSQRGIVR
ncbi:MAG: acyl-ACP--UDP-N-acetylglucosamine O-acyltransferase [Sutterellaceae bacterium]|nr:acyl-ACP--UDP-N-acetylglucosamine O-acyltransferase [Burkholderiaceae bacterium]MDW8429655.1 acyl-ACP--UDP-N-acetylglucosamine O-acyltransferase [Sutterellaceae bacterium]